MNSDWFGYFGMAISVLILICLGLGLLWIVKFLLLALIV